MNALNASLAGMQSAEARFDTSASRVASASVPGSNLDPARELVGMSAAKTELEASVAVARTVSSTLGTLVDLFA